MPAIFKLLCHWKSYDVHQLQMPNIKTECAGQNRDRQGQRPCAVRSPQAIVTIQFEQKWPCHRCSEAAHQAWMGKLYNEMAMSTNPGALKDVSIWAIGGLIIYQNRFQVHFSIDSGGSRPQSGCQAPSDVLPTLGVLWTHISHLEITLIARDLPLDTDEKLSESNIAILMVQV